MPGDTDSAVASLVEEASRLGLALDRNAADKFRIYIEVLLFWSTRLSLTGASTAHALAFDHILDSLHVCGHVPPGAHVADLGSGAGFPGVPIAIACPSAFVTLVESRRKRANFLREVIRQTGLANTQVLEERAEALASRHGNAFDVVVSRAFGSLELFLKLAMPVLKPGGELIAMKGPKSRTESYRPSTEFDPPRNFEYRLPSGRTLTLVSVRKPPAQSIH